jgi:hypothetical protein
MENLSMKLLHCQASLLDRSLVPLPASGTPTPSPQQLCPMHILVSMWLIAKCSHRNGFEPTYIGHKPHDHPLKIEIGGINLSQSWVVYDIVSFQKKDIYLE